ncbi:hypothetical protein HK096_007022, partial [Nowakowskiella sp. JEL0078]
MSRRGNQSGNISFSTRGGNRNTRSRNFPQSQNVNSQRQHSFIQRDRHQLDNKQEDSIHSLLNKILLNDSDQNYARRIAAANQLSVFINSLSTSDLVHATDILLRPSGLENALEDSRAPNLFKQAVSKSILALSLGLQNPDPFLDWLFARLNDGGVDTKTHMLFVLKELLDRPGRPLWRQASLIVDGLLAFMEEMDVEFMARVLDALQVVADNYPRDFGDAFK